MIKIYKHKGKSKDKDIAAIQCVILIGEEEEQDKIISQEQF